MTAGYFELSLVSVAFDTVALMLLGRKVEPIWGAAEFIKFIMVRTRSLASPSTCAASSSSAALLRSRGTGWSTVSLHRQYW